MERWLPYTPAMSWFRLYRPRWFLTVCLALAVLLAQGLRVQLHSHAGASDTPTVHAHVQAVTSPVDHDEHTTIDVDVSFAATLKLLGALPLLALVALALAFAFISLPVTFSLTSAVRTHFLHPPYLAPPGRAPPR